MEEHESVMEDASRRRRRRKISLSEDNDDEEEAAGYNMGERLFEILFRYLRCYYYASSVHKSCPDAVDFQTSTQSATSSDHKGFDNVQDILSQHNLELIPSTSSSSSMDTADLPTCCFANQDCFVKSIAFMGRLQTAIWLLGCELGLIAQGSTSHVQSWVDHHVPLAFHSRAKQLTVSLLWSYGLAVVALATFWICQSTVRYFLHDLMQLHLELWSEDIEYNGDEHFHYLEGDQRNSAMHDNSSEHDKGHYNHDFSKHSSNSHPLLEEWTIDLQCKFVQGTTVGVLVAWMAVDVYILQFQTRVVYGGVLLLLALWILMVQIWRKHNRLIYNPSYGDDKGKSRKSPRNTSTAATTSDEHQDQFEVLRNRDHIIMETGVHHRFTRTPVVIKESVSLENAKFQSL